MHTRPVLTRLGLPTVGAHRPVVVALVVDALGSGLFLPFSVLFFLATTDLSVAQVGLAVSVGGVVRFASGPVAGSLSDSIGPRRVLVVANLLQGAGFVAYLFVHPFWSLVLATLLVQAGNAAFWSSYPPLVVALSAPGERERWFGLIGALRNAGFAVGALAAGVAVSLGGVAGYRALAIANAVSYLLAAVLLHRARTRGVAQRTGPPAGTSWRSVLADRPYLGLTLTNVAVATTSLALSLVMPVWAVENLGLPAWVPGAALTINCIMVGLLQGPVVAVLTGHRRYRALQLSAVLHVAASLVLLSAGATSVPLGVLLVLLGVVVYTVGELIEGPVSSTVAAEAAPDAARGRYLAVHQTSWNVASVVAPASLTALLAVDGLAVWGALSAVAVAGGVGIGVVARHLPAARVPVGAVLQEVCQADQSAA